MYIEPNTNIRLLKNVPLDTTYKHTLYFANETAQINYFISLTKHNLTGQTYQRVQKGKSKVAIQAELLYDCNYMMFQNTNFGNKWFYAFIKGVEYVNNTVSEITFEIDVMQTWYFDYKLRPCFVEREHSITDNVGDNIVGENLDLGDIICEAMSGTGFFNSYVAVIATAYSSTGTPGGYVSGLFTGLDYVSGLIDTPADVTRLLEYLKLAVDANKADSIVSIWVMPSRFFTNTANPVVEVAKVNKPTSLSGYVPRNKKLLTFPYNYLGVDCGNNSAIYRYEYFTSVDNTCPFSLTSAVTPNPEISLIPVDYNGDDFNYVEKLVMTGFPQVGFAIDTYRAWLAQEASGHAISMVGSGILTASSLGSGNVTGTLMGLTGFAQSVNNAVLATNRPPQAKGSTGTSSEVALRTKDFWFKRMHITPQYARMIDDYFDVYGYATKRVKIPNISSRPHWNYTKTRDCVIVGSIPSDDMKKICSIYDNGITFWKNGANVGSYSYNNSPV